MAIYARLENGTYAEVTGVYKTDGTEVTEIFQGDRLVYSATNEIYGSLPLYYNGKGYNLTDYRIAGNTVQDGTPSSDAPVDATGSGVRTGNLWNEDYTGISGSIKYVSVYVGNGSFTLSTSCPAIEGAAALFFLTGNVQSGASTVSNGVYKNRPITVTSTDGYVTVAYRYVLYAAGSTDPRNEKTMLNLGSTALPYEPYGFKLPLTVNGVEYPIYLGQVETTRRIKKLVLTGEEAFSELGIFPGGYLYLFRPSAKVGANGANAVSTHYIRAYNNNSQNIYIRSSRIMIIDSTHSTIADFKSYLAAQYAAGTPVTVWYVLAEPETGIVNEPLMKIGDYADTISFAQAGVAIPTINGENVLDMASPVKPSEVYIKGKGIKPTGYGQLTDVNSVNILDKDGRPIYVHGQ